MQNNILKAWNAGFTKRWHTHPIMCDTVDYDSGHQQRTAMLTILLFAGGTTNGLRAAIMHDQGECDVGDLSHPAKQKHPEIRKLAWSVEMQSIEEQGLKFPELNPIEKRRLHFCDWLDAYLFVLRTHPHILHQEAWVNQLNEGYLNAVSLGCSVAFNELIEAANEFYDPQGKFSEVARAGSVTSKRTGIVDKLIAFWKQL